MVDASADEEEVAVLKTVPKPFLNASQRSGNWLADHKKQAEAQAERLVAAKAAKPAASTEDKGDSDTSTPEADEVIIGAADFLWDRDDPHLSDEEVRLEYKKLPFNYFVCVKRDDGLYGYCRLDPLDLKKGRKFSSSSNSNLWSYLKSKHAELYWAHKRIEQRASKSKPKSEAPTAATVNCFSNWLKNREVVSAVAKRVYNP